MKRHFRIKSRIDQTFMFVSPDYQVKEVWEKVLREITRFCVCMALQTLVLEFHVKEVSLNSLILMYGYQIKPLVL